MREQQRTHPQRAADQRTSPEKTRQEEELKRAEVVRCLEEARQQARLERGNRSSLTHQVTGGRG